MKWEAEKKNSDSRKPTYLIWPQWVHAVSSYGQWISTNCAHYFNFPLGCIDFIFHTRVIHTSGRIFIKCTAIHIFRALKKRAQKRKKRDAWRFAQMYGLPQMDSQSDQAICRTLFKLALQFHSNCTTFHHFVYAGYWTQILFVLLKFEVGWRWSMNCIAILIHTERK